MINIAIIGGTGYTGVELLRLLSQHPQAQVRYISSRSATGTAVADIYPNLESHCQLKFCDPNDINFRELDLVFFATPHGVAQSMMSEVLSHEHIKVIDLSADFRLRNIEQWEHWYQQPHSAPQWVGQAVYGLPEVNRQQIQDARLIACPGCYPTSVQLGFLPLIANDLVDLDTLIANSASGISGAGRQASINNLFTEMSDNFKAYAVSGHRHLPEMEQGLADIAGAEVKLTFVPHLLPIIRGIHSTLYARLKKPISDIQKLYQQYFTNEPFVKVLASGVYPQTREVRGTNNCRIAVQCPSPEQAVILVAEDNLTKGAAGQAIQNMNIMFGFDEIEGLLSPSILP